MNLPEQILKDALKALEITEDTPKAELLRYYLERAYFDGYDTGTKNTNK